MKGERSLYIPSRIIPLVSRWTWESYCYFSFKDCNLRCDYCHNPETQKIYSYESSDANSQIRWMTAEEVFNEIDKDIPL